MVNKIKVKLLNFSENSLYIIYSSFRQCYSSLSADEIYKKCLKEKDIKKYKEFIKNILSCGHESPLEHVSFTFSISGVSRALTHQLVRHRIASYSQQSQRYVKMDNFKYIIPPSISKHKKIKKEFKSFMEEIKRKYEWFIKELESLGKHGEEVYQDARYILPQAVETKIVVTMNCRELLHFFKERCCNRAQWEIRQLAYKMLKICKEKLPVVFEKAGPKCISLGYCPESRRFSCGKFPIKEEVVKGV
ncbi:MAG: FAD-dependent thymidylate synthase [Endomicrobia bacterium]|nr:FAD-dependent thymidylate synthase [Endomicrobiia bacterium]MDW8056361.1 FAD-dependent thymidylate synthase [Elusimicrobiota bacterium]